MEIFEDYEWTVWDQPCPVLRYCQHNLLVRIWEGGTNNLVVVQSKMQTRISKT